MKVKIKKKSPTVYVKDYKTGRLRNEGPYKTSFDQLMYYAAWYFTNFPVDTIIIEYDFVEHTHEPYRKVLTRANLNKYKKFLIQNILSAEKCTDWDKTESPLCNWCEFEDHCKRDTYGIPPEIEISEDDIPF